ncbi:kinase-like domain-containing protein [Emericellopsis atlantica]|uniref:Kinase-like domain-containing protein n=1 Tax=Emericellopsis atlantica TaxID=2614577 RepID=A0A9P7ZDM0_9HYPO|nr:kinase-like domain-containing protein [Emericellopsis atlantica]KAG9249752.1 kinase-like domain-containing protein [Emericellopsis atlantica]
MLSSLRRISRRALGRTWKPLDLPASGFPKLAPHIPIEEETLPQYLASRYYPVRLGEVLQERYQPLSTVWLARDLTHQRHVALKLYVHSGSIGDQIDNEIDMYKRIEAGPKRHPGYDAIRPLLGSFDMDGPDGKHRRLVHTPLLESPPIVAFVLKQLFLALDFLHSECQVIHTDLKADNIMFSVEDERVFSDLEQAELISPSPRKEVAGRTIYTSRQLHTAKGIGVPVLCDFGSAVLGNIKHTEDVQPNVYRAPEVILEAPWSYEIDIWNAGCMVWDIYEGGHLFRGWDPEHDTYRAYRSRAHISEMIALLGPPPSDL